MTTEDGRLVGLVSSAGALQCGKVNICCLASTAVHDQETSSERNFAQENVFDIYTDVAAYMTWIGRTIKKMGGMLACDLAIEETNPEGHYFYRARVRSLFTLVSDLLTDSLPL